MKAERAEEMVQLKKRRQMKDAEENFYSECYMEDRGYVVTSQVR
jgi:hypothetical protein